MALRRVLRQLIILCLCFTMPAWAQQGGPYAIDNTQSRQLASEETGRRHELIVALPASYASSPDKHYPVLYFLDAYWDMPLVSAVHGNLVYDNLVPEFIMVGLSYPHGTNYGDERRRDFTPTAPDPQDKMSGGAPQFLAFLRETVVPLIESSYRVDTAERALSGSSLGGLFTLYAMYDDPAFFDRYIAISPAVGWDKYLFEADDRYAKRAEDLSARLFLSYGTDEYPPFRDPIIAFQEKIAARQYKGLKLMNHSMEGLRHSGVKGEGYTRGLMWAWKDLAPKGPSGLAKAMGAN